MNYRIKHTLITNSVGAAITATGFVYGCFIVPADGVLNQWESITCVLLLTVGIALIVIPWVMYVVSALGVLLGKYFNMPDKRAFKLHFTLQLKRRVTTILDRKQTHHGKTNTCKKNRKME